MKRMSLTKTMKSEISRLYGYVCLNCGSDKDIELHHIVPLCNGGRNEARNIVPLCYGCHCKAHDKSYKKRGDKGRKPLVEYEKVLPTLELYFDSQIGALEAKKRIGALTSKDDYVLTKNVWASFLDRYKKENSIRNFYNYIDTFAAQDKKKKATTKGVRP